MYGAYYRSTAKCKFEFVSLEQTNDDSKHNRQPKYLKRNLNTNNNEIRGGQKYIDYERKKRIPGSCYRCCVPYPKPSNNHYRDTLQTRTRQVGLLLCHSLIYR